MTLAVKLIESQFPPYEQVIPKANDKSVQVERAALIDALKRAQLMSSETRGVRITANTGVLRITSDNPDLGEVKEEIAAEYEGDEVAIGFNPRYVLEVLSQITEEQVVIDLSAELDPALVRPKNDSDYLGVVMPMRI